MKGNQSFRVYIYENKLCKMGRKRKLRYPTTTEIVDFIYNDQSLRSSIISLQNKLIELENPGDFISWADDTLNWDIACDLKRAFEQGKLVPVLPDKVPSMLRKQDCRNVIELVYYHFYHHKEILDIQSDARYPIGGPHQLTSLMNRRLARLISTEQKLITRYNKQIDYGIIERRRQFRH